MSLEILRGLTHTMEERDDVTLLRIRSPIEKEEPNFDTHVEQVYAVLLRLICGSFVVGCAFLLAFVTTYRPAFAALGVILLALSGILSSLHGPVLERRRRLFNGRMYETP